MIAAVPPPWPTDTAPGAALHVPGRPHWRCRKCGQESPCETQRADLLAGYEGMRLSLSMLVASQFVECMSDLYTLVPGNDAPSPQELYARWFDFTAELRTGGPPPTWSPRSEP